MPERGGRLGALADRLSRDEGVAGIAVGATVAVAVAGQAPVLAALAGMRPGATVLAVVATKQDAERLAGDLACFLGDAADRALGDLGGPVAVLPAWDTLPFERVSPEIASMGARHAVRWRLGLDADRPRVVVTSVRALMQRPTRTLPGAPIVIRTSEVIERDGLLARLASARLPPRAPRRAPR